MGHPAGAVFEVVNKGDETTVLKDGDGDFQVPTALVVCEDDADAGVHEELDEIPAPEPVERLLVDEADEKLARLMYDRYNEEVGGVAWNGDKLPPADEFFEDPAKQKQANAWRVLAVEVLELATEAGVLLPADAEKDPDRVMRAKLEVASVRPSGEGEIVNFHGVSKNEPYPEDGLDENNSFAKYSPSVSLEINVQNPALKGALKPGARFYADFTEAPDSAPREIQPPAEDEAAEKQLDEKPEGE